jgi:hypothetical protein
MEVHPNTINLSKEIWNDTQTEYLEKLLTLAEPSVDWLVSTMEPFLDHSWSSGMQAHLDELADLERDTIELKARWIVNQR